MKKILSIFCAFLAVSFAVFALEVDENEINSAGDSSAIQFENYGGPHAVIESAEAITGIGTELGREVAENLETMITVHPEGKYTLVHAVDLTVPEGLDADILIFQPSAGVDHIDNVRRILRGYLCSAYGYNDEDAQVLAVFITVYNAVYRGQMDYFSGKYKEIVCKNLTAESAGLSRNWEEWAGKTQIVIPLFDVRNGGLSTVDTTAISDDKVVEALQNEDDKAVEEREKLTEIKEREAQEASEKAKDAQKDSVKQKNDGNMEAAQASAKQASEQQQTADKKTAEVRTDRESIAGDKAAVLAAPGAAESVPVTGLFVVNAKKNFYTLQTVDALSGAVLKKSAVKEIRTRTVFVVSPQEYLAVCGVKDGHSAIRLCLIDSSTLEIIKQSGEDLCEEAEIVPVNGEFYTIVENEKNCNIAVYDANLTLKRQSTLAVSPKTPINITANGILVTDAKGNPRLLNLADLQEVWTSGSANAK